VNRRTELAMVCLIMGGLMALAAIIFDVVVIGIAGGYAIGIAYCIHTDKPRTQP